jgi:hypothetical protein
LAHLALHQIGKEKGRRIAPAALFGIDNTRVARERG